MSKFIKAFTFAEAFIKINDYVLDNFEFETESRIGACKEVIGLLAEISMPEFGAVIQIPNSRIDYEYAEKFWEFMISGGTDAAEAFKEYPNVAKFITKPKSDALPENFNTFYGPRIVAQLPAIIKELNEKENSRRATIQILQEQDQVLLDSDETLEYPCTDSITFNIRDGYLHMHTHMRSQNCAVVMQLDFYLMQRLFSHIAHLTDTQMGCYTHSIVSAHVFDRDIEYIKGFLNA